MSIGSDRGIAATASMLTSGYRARSRRTLTPPQRSILVAKACDEETFDAIAQSMGIAASTAKTHYVRALRRMRELLGPQEGDLR